MRVVDDSQPSPEIPANGKDAAVPEQPPVDAKPPEQARPMIMFKFFGLGSGDYEVSRSSEVLTPQQWGAAGDHCRAMADLMLRQEIINNLRAEAEEAQRKAIAVAPPSAFQKVRERFKHGGRPRG